MNGAGGMLRVDDLRRAIAAGVPGCTARVRVLDGVSLGVGAGELVCVTGAPGAGKTVLLLCAAGLARADAGAVRWRGRAAAAGGRVYLRAAELASRRGRTLAAGARLLLLDDADGPEAALLAAAWRSSGAAVLAAARDPRALAAAGARVLVLRAGRLERAHARVMPVRTARVAEPEDALR
ncbi:MAG TPA: ATP-binding cassette domain-containing protein [Gemmatimonadaceae bacterium]|nr:ATP-binding cassette domain-containing protein [Gemmatimonadaceae bacterium]